MKYSFVIKHSGNDKRLTIVGGIAKEESYSKRKGNTLNEEFIEDFFTLLKRGKQQNVAGHTSVLVFLSDFFVKDIPEAAIKRCSAKHAFLT